MAISEYIEAAPGRGTERMVEVLKAMAHPVRLTLVRELAHGPRSVTDLVARIGVPQAHVSQQLSILRMSKLVSVARRDGFAIYRLRHPGLRRLLACVHKCSALDERAE